MNVYNIMYVFKPLYCHNQHHHYYNAHLAHHLAAAMTAIRWHTKVSLTEIKMKTNIDKYNSFIGFISAFKLHDVLRPDIIKVALYKKQSYTYITNMYLN
jgi:hypothetical protein